MLYGQKLLLRGGAAGVARHQELQQCWHGADAHAGSLFAILALALVLAMYSKVLLRRATSGCRMTLLAAHGKGSFSVFGVAELPMWASPFMSLVLTSIIVPQASFLGHLAGIVAGFAVLSSCALATIFSYRRAP